MRITTYCEFDTSLSKDNSEIDNWEDYVKYINDLAWNRLRDKEMKIPYVSDKFGKLDIFIGIDTFINDIDGKATIFAWIKPEDQDATYGDEDWYNYMKTNSAFVDLIESKMAEYIEMANNILKDIQFPKDEELIFKNEYFYMKINIINPEHTPTFIPLTIDTTIDRNALIDNVDN